MSTAEKIKGKSLGILSNPLVRMAAFGSLAVAAGQGIQAVADPRLVVIGIAATMVSLIGQKNKETTKRKLLLASLATAAVNPIVGAAAILFSPVNPIVYLFRKMAAANKEKEMAALGEHRAKIEEITAQISTLPPAMQKVAAAQVQEMFKEKEKAKLGFGKGKSRAPTKEAYDPKKDFKFFK